MTMTHQDFYVVARMQETVARTTYISLIIGLW